MIELTFTVYLDDEDADLANRVNLYPKANGSSPAIYRVIAERVYGPIPDNYHIDHIDRNPLNNTRV